MAMRTEHDHVGLELRCEGDNPIAGNTKIDRRPDSFPVNARPTAVQHVDLFGQVSIQRLLRFVTELPLRLLGDLLWTREQPLGDRYRVDLCVRTAYGQLQGRL